MGVFAHVQRMYSDEYLYACGCVCEEWDRHARACAQGSKSLELRKLIHPIHDDVANLFIDFGVQASLHRQAVVSSLDLHKGVEAFLRLRFHEQHLVSEACDDMLINYGGGGGVLVG